MTKFNRLYLELMESRRGDNFDTWNLQQVGLDKGSYVSRPTSKSTKLEPEPKLIECPSCGKRFYNEDGCHDA